MNNKFLLAILVLASNLETYSQTLVNIDSWISIAELPTRILTPKRIEQIEQYFITEAHTESFEKLRRCHISQNTLVMCYGLEGCDTLIRSSKPDNYTLNRKFSKKIISIIQQDNKILILSISVMSHNIDKKNLFYIVFVKDLQIYLKHRRLIIEKVFQLLDQS